MTASNTHAAQCEPSWLDIEVPDGFELSQGGVHKATAQSGAVKICGPLWVKAMTRDVSSKGWGLYVCWSDQDGNECECAFPMAQLHGRAKSPVIERLAAEGLHIIPGQDRAVLTYLGSFECAQRLHSASQTGWLSIAEAPLTFVLPNAVLSTADHLEVIFQPEQYSGSAESLKTSGSLRQWQAQIAKRTEGNPVLIFALCTALTPPLLGLAEMDSFGANLYGYSSQGKTTALQVAASVWGDGSDPAASASSSIQRWNVTANALEGLAAAHNDGFLPLDEMGTYTGANFGNSVYNLLGGQGKARMNDQANLKASRTWRLVALSSGELSIQDKIEEGGQRAMAGQINRFLDIPVTDKIILNSHGVSPGQYADKLKEACGRCYGVAGAEFIDRLIHQAASKSSLRTQVQTLTADYHKRLIGPLNLENYQQRGLKRFALICTAAHLAAGLGILPLSLEDTLNAIQDMSSTWLKANISEAQQGVLAIRNFILRYQDSKFPSTAAGEYMQAPRFNDIAGYYHPSKQCYAFTPEGFKRACDGLDHTRVASALAEFGLLEKGEQGRLTIKMTIPDSTSRPRLYAVKESILEMNLGDAS